MTPLTVLRRSHRVQEVKGREVRVHKIQSATSLSSPLGRISPEIVGTFTVELSQGERGMSGTWTMMQVENHCDDGTGGEPLVS